MSKYSNKDSDNSYASEASSVLSKQVEAQNVRRKSLLMTASEIKKHNLEEVSKYAPWTSAFYNNFVCMCYGCRTRFSPNYLNMSAEEVRELIENDELFCPWCKDNDGASIAFRKLLQAFPKSFIFGEHKTIISKLPQEAFKKITKWNEKNVLDGDCSNSLYVYGATGSGKSRIITLVALKNLEYGITMNCLRGGQFASQLRKYTEEGNKGGESAWLDNLTRCNVLIFDDFGRDNLTPAMFEKLWNVLDSRLGNKTTIFLSNFEPEKNPNLDQSLIRRVADFCSLCKI